MTFKIGDTVKLKSGGPVMTIGNLNQGPSGSESATCHWFVEGDPKTSNFVTATLKAVAEGNIPG